MSDEYTNGSHIVYAFSPEGTAETYDAPVTGQFLEQDGSANYNDAIEQVARRTAKGTRGTFRERRVSKKNGSGEIPHILSSKTALDTFSCILGKDPAETSTSTYTFTSKSDSNLIKTATVARINTATGLQKQFAGAMVNTATIEGEANGDFIMNNLNLLGGKIVDQTDLTVEFFSDEEAYTPDNVTIKIASNKAGIAGATALPWQSFSTQFDNKVEVRGQGGSIEQQYMISNGFDVTGSFGIDKENDTDFQAAIDGDTAAMQILLSKNSHTITINLDVISFESPEIDQSLEGPLILNRNFEVQEPDTNVSIVVDNGVVIADYPYTA